MIKRLTRHGNSMALVIDRPVLDLLKIDPETPLEITTDGERLVVAPLRDPEELAKFEADNPPRRRRFGRAAKAVGQACVACGIACWALLKAVGRLLARAGMALLAALRWVADRLGRALVRLGSAKPANGNTA